MKIALVGNPNSGKTSIFNNLTGLNQQVGNYPGVTVDQIKGKLKHKGKEKVTVLDLPGTYSLYARTRDEEIVSKILLDKSNENYPDLVVVTVDASNLKRNLLLFSQIYDLKIPMVMALNMTDVADKKGYTIDIEKLSELFGGVPVVPVIARSGKGIDNLIKTIIEKKEHNHTPFQENEFDSDEIEKDVDKQAELSEKRFHKIRQYLGFVLKEKKEDSGMIRRHRKVDRVLTHPVFGYLIFLGVLMLIFQAVYAWSEWPMDLIDSVFLNLSQWVVQTLPDGIFTSLLAEGIIPGLGGVVIFIPQIALLFTFIFFLEETGYMSRVVFMMDRLMRPFGLNGRSVVPLISGVACAVPAIMASRTIDNWKERLITIMVTPLMSCSARLPVYTLLIAIVIPDQSIWIFNLKGLTLLGLYLIGLIAALASALLFKLFIRSKQYSFLVMELPLYKMPRWNNLTVTIYQKVSIFVFEAGKVIFAISIVLWLLASFGPGDRMEQAVSKIPQPTEAEDMKAYQKKVSSTRLSNSYIGILGKGIEPVIEPLGFNWQIGIALITSFAAREVFVGSIATIYSVGEDFDNNETLISRMKNEINPETGEKVYTTATGISLMIFYAFAMQCMSTFAIVVRETNGWKWALIQTAYMTLLAYVSSYITFQLLA